MFASNAVDVPPHLGHVGGVSQPSRKLQPFLLTNKGNLVSRIQSPILKVVSALVSPGVVVILCELTRYFVKELNFAVIVPKMFLIRVKLILPLAGYGGISCIMNGASEVFSKVLHRDGNRIRSIPAPRSDRYAVRRLPRRPRAKIKNAWPLVTSAGKQS
ncbi:hypothetical protein GWK47_013497 [Chionoecetes opilio]|uniref:Uncharacterized protein n=1 Tax=Chionoecetes opilio TaxID=41210 RepID=A0A8J4Y130_CHIOP|nr:hypothetical protein GWK47_013497 [Chionoecetes opilio]